MVTVAPETKLAPLTVTEVPPLIRPACGVMLETLGGDAPVYWKPLDRAPVCASGFVTRRWRVPPPAGGFAVMVVALTRTTDVAATPPIFSVAPESNAVPVTVIAVPPATGPVFGTTEVTPGGQEWKPSP